MDSVVLCYARADDIFARDLARFLETNLPFAVSCTEAIVDADLDLIEATERALSAEAALVLLSPQSVPKVWNRKTWEPVFLEKPKEFQTRLGYVMIHECKFPDLFRRERFFNASIDPRAAFREIKRWLLRPAEPVRKAPPVEPLVEDLRKTISDQPGVAHVQPPLALQFEGDCGGDFEAVYRLNLQERSRAGMAGDLRNVIDLPYTGQTSEDEALFQNWCAGHRVLFLLAGVAPEDCESIAPCGRASVIFTEHTLPESIPSAVADAVRKFESVPRADLETRLRLGWNAINLLKQQSRFAEVTEVLEALAHDATSHGDTNALKRIEREQYWVQLSEGSNDLRFAPSPPGGAQQLTFSFVA